MFECHRAVIMLISVKNESTVLANKKAFRVRVFLCECKACSLGVGRCAHVYVHGGHASRRRHTATRAKPRKSSYLPREHQEHLSVALALEGTSGSAATSAETIAAFVKDM